MNKLFYFISVFISPFMLGAQINDCPSGNQRGYTCGNVEENILQTLVEKESDINYASWGFQMNYELEKAIEEFVAKYGEAYYLFRSLIIKLGKDTILTGGIQDELNRAKSIIGTELYNILYPLEPITPNGHQYIYSRDLGTIKNYILQIEKAKKLFKSRLNK